MLDTFILYEAALITDLECLEQRADRGEAVRAQEVTDLLARYGASFDELPHYLQDTVNRIDLED